MVHDRSNALPITIILLVAIGLAVGNLVVYTLSVQQLVGSPVDLSGPGLVRRLTQAVDATYRSHPDLVWYFAAAPLVAGLVSVLLLGRRTSRVEPAAHPPAPRPPAPTTTDSALQLLGILQREGRLIDFLEENIDDYSDAQIGAAVRSIHTGCRQTLHDRMKIERIYQQEDGTKIELAPGFDRSLVRLTGNVQGNPPFRGTLQHGGWRVAEVTLPSGAEQDPSILAPAEIEIA